MPKLQHEERDGYVQKFRGVKFCLRVRGSLHVRSVHKSDSLVSARNTANDDAFEAQTNARPPFALTTKAGQIDRIPFCVRRYKFGALFVGLSLF